MDADTPRSEQPQIPRRRRVEDIEVEQNKTIARELLERSLGSGDLTVIDRYASEDIEVFDPALLQPVKGRDAFRSVIENYRTVFADLDFRVLSSFAEGAMVCLRWRAAGTHQAEFLGVPGTGRRAEATGLSIMRVEDGRVVEERAEWDALGLLRQLVDVADVKADDLRMRAEIAGMMTGFAEAFNRADAIAVSSFFAEDATLVNPAGVRGQGREEIGRVFEDDLRRILAGSRSTFILDSLRRCGPSLAFVDVTHHVEGARGEQVQGDLDLHVVCLCEKVGGRWLWRDARPYLRLTTT